MWIPRSVPAMLKRPRDEFHIGDGCFQKMCGCLFALLDDDIAGGDDGTATLHHGA